MEKLFNEIIEYIKKNHFNSHLINWEKIEKEEINTKKDIVIYLEKKLLPKLRDNHHSNFRININNRIYTNRYNHIYRKSLFKKYYIKPEKYFSEIPQIKVFNNILYINAPRTWNQEYWIEYYNIINNALKNYQNYNGIIFDLSECLGGYYAPIIAPFYQIFGKTIIAHGYNQNFKTNCFTHILVKGKNNDPDSWIKQIKFNPNKISDNKQSSIKIIIITSSYTGSAGEFATLFFKNRNNVIIIGEKTAGLTTWQNIHYLKSDPKSYLNIGIAFSIDRNNLSYNKKFYIKPDYITSNPIKKAIKLINSL